MELQEAIQRQRIRYIISSYGLHDVTVQGFDDYLEILMATYPWPLIELALVETLIKNWLQIPMVRGYEFLTQVHEHLQSWEEYALLQPESRPCAIASTVTPDQFQQITNLDPGPIFGYSTSAQEEDRAASV
jgi:hypothetical protein